MKSDQRSTSNTAFEKTGNNEIVVPDHWAIRVTPEKITIVQNQFMMGCLASIYLLFPSLCFLAATKTIAGYVPFLFVLINLLLSIRVGFYIADKANKTIEIDHQQIKISQSLMPWWKLSIDKSEIVQFYCAAIYNAGPHKHKQSEYFTYQLELLTKKGKRQTIVGDFETKADAVALERLLENFLTIRGESISPSSLDLVLATKLSRQHHEYNALAGLFMVICLLIVPIAFLGIVFFGINLATRRPDIRGLTYEDEILKKQIEERSEATLEAIQGTRWKCETTSAFLLMELREDKTGFIQIEYPNSKMTEEMIYEVLELNNQPTLKMSFKDQSQLFLRIQLNGDGSEAKMYWLKKTGHIAEIIVQHIAYDPFLRVISDSAFSQ